MRRSVLIVALALVPALLGAATVVTAQTPSSPPTLSRPTITFSPVLLARTSTPPRLDRLADSTGVTLTGSLTEAEAQAQFGRPRAVVPPEATVRSQAKTPPGLIRARGAATWYCVPGVSACHRDYDGGLYAAAGKELRVGEWRGRKVTVCATVTTASGSRSSTGAPARATASSTCTAMRSADSPHWARASSG